MLYIFYNTVFIPAVIQGYSHLVRIKPGTGLQQSSVLTTELRRTPIELRRTPTELRRTPTELRRTPNWATPHPQLSYAALRKQTDKSFH